jgi:hypothetical protein
VPWIAVGTVLILCLVSYCQVSSSASIVITYLTGLVGSAQVSARTGARVPRDWMLTFCTRFEAGRMDCHGWYL